LLFLYLLDLLTSFLLCVAAAIGISVVTSLLSPFLLRFPAPKKSAVLVTGCSSGFGRIFTQLLAKRGHVVFAGVRKVEDGDKLREFTPQPLRHLIYPVILDVTKEEQVKAAFETVKHILQEQDLGLFALVNNAAIVAPCPLELQSLQTLKSVFDVNVFGATHVTQTFIPLLREYNQTRQKNKMFSANARIVFISSASGYATFKFLGGYVATKCALESMADSFRQELVPWNIGVSIIFPGMFDTEMATKDLADSQQKLNHERLSLYTDSLAKWLRTMNLCIKHRSPVYLVADCLERLLYAKYPAKKQWVGRDALFISVVGWLCPDSVIDLLAKTVL